MNELLTSIRAFLDERVIPLEREFLASPFAAMEPRLAALRAEVRQRNLWAPHLPAALGGRGLSLTDFAHVSALLGETPIGHYVFNCQAPDIGNCELLLAHGTDEQKRRWLEPLARGEIRSCFSMTEPEFAGSNPVWIGTTATREGDSYRIDGHKWFTSSADGAAFTIVMAVTAAGAPPHERASQIIVPLDTPGVTRVRNISVMGDTGSGYASHAELRFEGVRVPVANRIGDEGAGFTLAQERLGPGRIHHCMRWLGICERAFRLMCDRAARVNSRPVSHSARSSRCSTGSPSLARRSTRPVCSCLTPPGKWRNRGVTPLATGFRSSSSMSPGCCCACSTARFRCTVPSA